MPSRRFFLVDLPSDHHGSGALAKAAKPREPVPDARASLQRARSPPPAKGAPARAKAGPRMR
jgi:hypothetical protein